MHKFITVDGNNYKYFYLILTSAKLLILTYNVPISYGLAIHGTTGEIPAERLKFERSNLQPLPLDYSGSHPAALEIMEDKGERFSTVSLQHSLCIYQSVYWRHYEPAAPTY